MIIIIAFIFPANFSRFYLTLIFFKVLEFQLISNFHQHLLFNLIIRINKININPNAPELISFV